MKRLFKYPPVLLLSVAIPLLLLCGLITSVSYAESPPEVPHAFYGSLTINGSPAPIGTLIEAKVDGVVCGEYITTVVGQYGDATNPLVPPLVVQGSVGNTLSGKVINFWVNGVDTGLSAVFQEGAVTQLDLVLNEVVTFPDPNLEAAIRQAINKPTGDIYKVELEYLTTLNANSKGITNLSGIQHCINLTKLQLEFNYISNLTPLVSLGKITELYLNNNQIVDVSPLANMTNLQILNLNTNYVQNISPLAALINISYLMIGNNYVEDVSELYTLTNLVSLTLGWNRITDISSLAYLINLTDLYLSHIPLSNITPLAGLTNIKQLYLEYDQIHDILPLVANAGLSTGDTIDLRGNPLSSDSLIIYKPQLQLRGVTVIYDPPPPGDANGDGLLDAADITAIERIICGLNAPYIGADANQDGKINALDITKLERLIAHLD